MDNFNNILNIQERGRMVKRTEIDYNRLILAFLAATFLFLIGVLIGYLIRMNLTGSAIKEQDILKNDIVDLETISLMQVSYPCNSLVLYKSSEKLDAIGEMINVLETKKGKDDPDVLELKKVYSILEFRHYMLVKTRNEKCNSNFSTILYFYSNEKNCKDNTDKVSFILSYLKKKYSDFNVYSFDLNLDSDIISILKKEYNLKGCSQIVLNDKKINQTIDNSSVIESLI